MTGHICVGNGPIRKLKIRAEEVKASFHNKIRNYPEVTMLNENRKNLV